MKQVAADRPRRLRVLPPFAIRWLLYTRPLVDVHDPRRQPFNSVGLVQYAYDEREMPGDLWIDHLLERGFDAHNGVLPDGSLLIALMCEKSNAVAVGDQEECQDTDSWQIPEDDFISTMGPRWRR